MDDEARGRCLCGAVTFRLAGRFDRFFLCHCSRCRKDSGSAHSANLFSASATIGWLSGEDNVATFELAGSRHVKSFCKTCGSALPVARANGAVLVVPAGALDTPVVIRPEAHICCSDRAQWDEDLACVESLDGLPG